MVLSTRRFSVKDGESSRQYDLAEDAQAYCTGASEFIKWKVVLCDVDTLELGPQCEFAVDACPNVQTISTNEWR